MACPEPHRSHIHEEHLLPPSSLYSTTHPLRRTLRVCYPAGHGRMVLRTELDWERDVPALGLSPDGTTWTFQVEASQPFVYFKPCLIDAQGLHWAQGANKLLLLDGEDAWEVYPYFFAEPAKRISELVIVPSAILGREHRVRAFLPPGYHENTLATYSTAYMQDGQNLFLPEDAYLGQDWDVDTVSDLLVSMSAMEETVFIGVYSKDRMHDYTLPGYEAYSRSLAEEMVPEAERRLRLRRERARRTVWGSSLGGVVSFHTAWQHPEVFGGAVCMSSTFSYQDNLLERVLQEPSRDVAFYLDSGWPGDNYEVTLAMALALVRRGWVFGRNLFHVAVPLARHDEQAWSERLHLPMQLVNGAVARASRLRHPVLGSQVAAGGG